MSRTPYLALSATTSKKDNSMEHLIVMFDKVKVREHIWKDSGTFLKADPFKILHILGFAPIDCPQLLSRQVFDWIEVW